MKVKIPIYHHTDASREAEKTYEAIGKDFDAPLDEFEVVIATFYHISVVDSYRYRTENKEEIVTIIHTGNTSFLSPMSKEEVEELIDKANK